MKKYIIKNADGSEQSKMQAIHESRREAESCLIDYVRNHNEDLDVDDGDYLYLFDYIIEEVESEEVKDIITDFESARKALCGSPNMDFTIVKLMHSRNVIPLRTLTNFVLDINPKHIEALIALNKLFTIAQAWNKEDGFVPDFSDREQKKWFPWFSYNEDIERFFCSDSTYSPSGASTYFGSRICFISCERATRFGMQFIDLFNKVFL